MNLSKVKMDDFENEEETVASISTAVELATHSLDGAFQSDDELDKLCDNVCSEQFTTHGKLHRVVKSRELDAAGDLKAFRPDVAR